MSDKYRYYLKLGLNPIKFVTSFEMFLLRNEKFIVPCNGGFSYTGRTEEGVITIVILKYGLIVVSLGNPEQFTFHRFI